MGLRNIRTCNSICTQLVANDFGEVDKIPIDCNERPESVKIIPVNLTIVDDFDDDDYLESENMVHSSDPSFYFPREYLSMQQQIIRVEMYVGEWCRLRGKYVIFGLFLTNVQCLLHLSMKEDLVPFHDCLQSSLFSIKPVFSFKCYQYFLLGPFFV